MQSAAASVCIVLVGSLRVTHSSVGLTFPSLCCLSVLCLFSRRTYSITGCPVYPGSQFQYNAFHGMQLGIVSWDSVAQRQKMDVCFYSLENGGAMIDQFEMPQSSTAK